MIYTSYFANLKNLPSNVIPISICSKAPDGYKGLQYKKLAPKYSFFAEWKNTHDNEYYIKCYKEQVLDILYQNGVVMDLKHLCNKSMYDDVDICLVCYEKEGFCHRHLVSEWLRQGGYDCVEF